MDQDDVCITIKKPTLRSHPKLLVTGELPKYLSFFLGYIPGVKIDDDDLVWVPREPRLLELLLRDIPPPVQLSDTVRTWYDATLKYEKKRVALTKLEDIVVPGVDERLTAFQRVGVNFVLNNKRCILADDVGMGKTAQVLEAIELSERQQCVLVICTNSAKWWWKDEIEKWFPGQDRFVVEAATRRDDILRFQETQGFLIINWELVRLLPQLKNKPWHWIVADEAHRLKNHTTQTWKHVNGLITQRLVLLTATPISNAPSDLWALLHLLYSAKYPSYKRFYEMYVNYTVDRNGFNKINRAKPTRNVELLQREIAPMMLRRDKDTYRSTLPPQNKVSHYS